MNFTAIHYLKSRPNLYNIYLHNKMHDLYELSKKNHIDTELQKNYNELTTICKRYNYHNVVFNGLAPEIIFVNLNVLKDSEVRHSLLNHFRSKWFN